MCSDDKVDIGLIGCGSGIDGSAKYAMGYFKWMEQGVRGNDIITSPQNFEEFKKVFNKAVEEMYPGPKFIEHKSFAPGKMGRRHRRAMSRKA